LPDIATVFTSGGEARLLSNITPVGGAGSTSITFNPSTNIDLQTLLGVTVSLLGADFDQDNEGNLDLVSLIFSSGLLEVELLLGDGAGGFAPPAIFSVGSAPTQPTAGPHQMASGDLNEDDLLDLVVVHEVAQRLEILLGDPTLGFIKIQAFSLGAAPSTVSLADLSNDGVLDLLVTTPNQLLIFPGLGSAQFGTPLILEAGVSPVSVVFGDLNEDGALDLVLAEKGAATVRVFLANP
jgi:hypothetical protein